MGQARSAQGELEQAVPSPLLRQGRLVIKNDGETGQTYGGNKVRKLAPLFAELRRRGATRLVTVGAAGSHHVLATALFAPAEGLQVSALLFPQPSTPHVVDVLRAIVASQVNLIPCTQAISAATRLGRMLGPNTAWVGPGAIGPCATSGYDTAFAEWLAQRAGASVEAGFEHHVVAAGSGGTAAGLLFGMVSRNIPGRVVAVAVNHNPTLRQLILAQARWLGHSLGVPVSLRALARSLVVDSDAVGRGYGYATDASARAIRLAADVGLCLEHTYTAKAYAKAHELAARADNDTVVFWQTVSQRPMSTWLKAAPPVGELSRALRALLLEDGPSRNG